MRWDAMYRVRESKSKLELFYRMFIKLYCHIFWGRGLQYMFERALKLSLHIPKICSAFQVLKCFIFYFLRLLASFLHAQQILTCDRLSQRALLSLGKAVVSHLKLKAWLNQETLLRKHCFLLCFLGVAKLSGNKQNVLLPRWLNEETLFPKTKELRMRAMIN